jgi:hypothetical protein
MKSHIESRLEKALEPPPLNQRKPLPVSQERPKQHRGGKKIRAAKKKYEMTEVRKYMNRVPLGVEEQEEYRDTGHLLECWDRQVNSRYRKLATRR